VSTLQFTDSIDQNLELLQELIDGMPQGAKVRGQNAAAAVGNVIHALRRDNPKDPAVAIGVALAIFSVGQQMVHAQAETDKPLIQLIGG